MISQAPAIKLKSSTFPEIISSKLTGQTIYCSSKTGHETQRRVKLFLRVYNKFDLTVAFMSTDILPVDVATRNNPSLNAWLIFGLRVNFLAPPVIEISRFGRFSFHIDRSKICMERIGVL